MKANLLLLMAFGIAVITACGEHKVEAPKPAAAKAKIEPAPDSKSEMKPESKSDPKSDPKTEITPSGKPNEVLEASPEIKTEAKPDVIPQVKSDPAPTPAPTLTEPVKPPPVEIPVSVPVPTPIIEPPVIPAAPRVPNAGHEEPVTVETVTPQPSPTSELPADYELKGERVVLPNSPPLDPKTPMFDPNF